MKENGAPYSRLVTSRTRHYSASLLLRCELYENKGYISNIQPNGLFRFTIIKIHAKRTGNHLSVHHLNVGFLMSKIADDYKSALGLFLGLLIGKALNTLFTL